MGHSEMDSVNNSNGVGLAFLLSEFRELRRGMESRDAALRAAIDGVRDSMNDLATKVDLSKNDVDAMRTDVESVRKNMRIIRDDVDIILEERKVDGIRRESSWSGPKRVGTIIVFLGSVAAGATALWKFWPLIVAL